MTSIKRVLTLAGIWFFFTAGGCGDSKEKKAAADSAGGAGGTTGGSGGSGGSSPAGGEGGQSETSGAGGVGTTTSSSGGTATMSSTSSGGAAATTDGGMGGEGGVPIILPPAEAGYVDVEPYTFDGGAELPGLTTSSARLFYSFQEADAAPETRPLFLFTGGIPDLFTDSILPGPAATGLFPVFGMGHRTLLESDLGAGLSENVASWTELGNLLFIDGRQAGFSYATLTDPADDGARGAEYASDNFNNFTDAADMVRALLRFFELHPELSSNPVIIVSQGYGSIRSSLMLSYLLFPERLLAASDWNYVDEDLADEIIAHHDSVAPDNASDPAILSQQFGWQVQIQPKVGGAQDRLTDDLWCQPGTPEAEAAEELAETCPPPSRDTLHLDRNAGWSLMLRQASTSVLTNPDSFLAALFVDPRSIDGLPAADRTGAYRLSTMLATEGVFPNAPAVWTDGLGTLPTYDRYYVSDASRLIVGNSNFTEGNDVACLMFIETLQYVATFVTNARFDGLLRTDALAATLTDCATYTATPILDAATHDTAARDGVDRPGWLTLEYNASAALGATTRTARMPAYPNAGHLVSVSAGPELKEDVQAFLAENGL